MKRIDIELVIKNKAPQLHKKLPKFVIRFMKWLVCQKQLNEILENCEMYEGPDFAIAMSRYMNVTYTVHGLDKIDVNGHYLMVSNHPLGAYDGISYIAVLGKKFPGLKIVVNDILMNIDQLRCMFLPVNTVGRQKRSDMEAIERAYRDENVQMMSFPAGFCSRFMNGKIQDIPWKKSVITKAIDSKRDIIPMYFKGRNSLVFYALEWFRRIIGVKFNIGLILLPWQMARYARGKHYTIIVGDPIPYQTFDKSRTHAEWAQWLREKCYDLKKNSAFD